MKLVGYFLRSILVWLLLGPLHAFAACTPQVLAIQSAQGAPGALAATPQERAMEAWGDVQLPNEWQYGRPNPEGVVWYRIDWERRCAGGADTGSAVPAPVALGVDWMSLAGEVYSNDTLLWRDASLVEPLSRSWNMPRWWVLPEPSLHSGRNTVWIKVIGLPEITLGMGDARLGSIDEVQATFKARWWRQRTVYMLNAGIALAVGGLFLVVWWLRRSELSFGWYGLVSLSWAAYLGTILVTDSQPWHEALTWSRLNVAFFVAYIGSLCMFMWRFGGQCFPRLEQFLLCAVALSIAAVLLAPRESSRIVFSSVWFGFALAFILNCVQYQWWAWRPHSTGANRQHRLLAVCWLLLLAVGIHDIFLILDVLPSHRALNPIVGPAATFLMALLVGGRFAQGMRRIELFNDELEQRVSDAREELGVALSRVHAQAMENAKLQERMQIAHDLHDGLGGSLVRGLALAEQAPDMMPKERVLSLLKSMRDDLRQMIDHGSSSSSITPETPLQWIAPVRHRFTRILDELDVATHWRIEPEWRGDDRPTALQCLSLTRLVEEALSNVIKHSQARHVRVSVVVDLEDNQPPALSICIEDDGIGFDVLAVQRAGLSVGVKSMSARAERMGALFSLQSGSSGTSVRAVVPIVRSMTAMAYPVPDFKQQLLWPDQPIASESHSGGTASESQPLPELAGSEGHRVVLHA